jgi:hypothetical protein
MRAADDRVRSHAAALRLTALVGARCEVTHKRFLTD